MWIPVKIGKFPFETERGVKLVKTNFLHVIRCVELRKVGNLTKKQERRSTPNVDPQMLRFSTDVISLDFVFAFLTIIIRCFKGQIIIERRTQ